MTQWYQTGPYKWKIRYIEPFTKCLFITYIYKGLKFKATTYRREIDFALTELECCSLEEKYG